MIQFEMDVDVPESRQVTLTLPPGTPTGPTHIAIIAGETPEPSVRYHRPADPGVAAEFDEFMRLLPRLRPTHGGHFVAVRACRVIASGAYLDAVLKLAKAEAGGAPFFCEWIEPVGGYVFRSGNLMIPTEPERV